MPGEFELIAKLRERIASAGVPLASERLVVGSGDDAAVTAADGAAVISVDAAIEGVHSISRSPLFGSVGHKALAAALSDLAAMGAEPGEGFLQLALPEGFAEADSLALADGFAEVAAAVRMALAGGDVSRAPALILAVTVIGYVASPERAVLRSGANAGDTLVLTGELGAAAAGLRALRESKLADGLAPEVAEALRLRQLEPWPRIEAGRALADAGATALIDVSDGLGADAVHLARASGVGARIELARVPVAPGVAEVAEAAELDRFDLAAGEGEDYELLAALPPERLAEASEAVAAAGSPLTEVGEVTPDGEVRLVDPSGASRAPSGYDQLVQRVPAEPA